MIELAKADIQKNLDQIKDELVAMQERKTQLEAALEQVKVAITHAAGRRAAYAEMYKKLEMAASVGVSQEEEAEV